MWQTPTFGWQTATDAGISGKITEFSILLCRLIICLNKNLIVEKIEDLNIGMF
jgi:hypothetical protein